MLAVVFLAVLASVSADPQVDREYPSYPSYGHDSGPTFEEVKDMLAGGLNTFFLFFLSFFLSFPSCLNFADSGLFPSRRVKR